MLVSLHQTPFQQAFALPSIQQGYLNKTVHFQIDKNLSLKLTLKQIKGAILFQGIILYRNGTQLKLQQKSWRLVSNFSQLKISNLLFFYNFNQQTVNLTSKILFMPHLPPKDKFVSEHLSNILNSVKSFVSTLYRYRIIKLSTRFFFSQFLQEAKLKRKLCLQLKNGNQASQMFNTDNSSKQSKMTDEKEERHSSSNIRQRFITQCTVEDLSEIPKHLSGGPKNHSVNFRNKNTSSIISGGFFEIGKLMCSLKKKLQTLDYSNHKSGCQNNSVTDPKFQGENEEDQQKYDILARKTLKGAKKQHESNHLKISKELIIVQQIKEKKHLLKYYKNTNKWSPESGVLQMILQTSEEGQSSDMASQASNSSMAKKQQKKSFKYEKEIHMEFHPHTLKDFIRKPNRSVEETLEVCYQLSEATMQMHQSGVIHRDLKPQNVLIDYNSLKNKQLVKVIDFAESAIHTEAVIDPELYRSSRQAIDQIIEKYDPRLHGATLPYSPPECQHQRSERISPGVNSYKIDSWSMGMILLEVYQGKRPVHFSRPYADDIISLIRDSGLQIHLSRVSRKGFDIGEGLITYMGMKNLLYNQSLRLDVMRSCGALYILNKYLGRWKKSIRDKSSKGQFSYSKG